jgi:hypothetical protein
MQVEIAADFYTIATHRVPLRLVAEPPNLPACVSALRAIGPIPGEGRPQPRPTAVQLKRKCEDLYQTIKAQTLSYLVSSYRNIAFAAARGVTVTDEEVQQQLARVKVEQYPKPGEFERYLSNERRSLAQELFMVKISLLQQKLQQGAQGEGIAAVEKLMKDENGTSEGANCRKGYIVEHCKQFKGQVTYSGPSGAVLLEEIARWRPETSHGFTGVPVVQPTAPPSG